MADIFLSYAREDLDRVKQLVAALENQGWSVWWDRTIRPGLSFDEVVDKELGDARCVVVLWSQASVASRWVKAESMEAADRGSLVPVLLERDVRVPVGFRTLQAADLSDWDGSGQHHGFWQLAMALTTLAQPRLQDRGATRPSVSLERVQCPRCHAVYPATFLFCPKCGSERVSAEAAGPDREEVVVTELLKRALDSQYAVVRVLQRGGTAYVFLATDARGHREVAIKAYPAELMMGIGRERFVRAARIARSVQHPHIVPIYTAGIAEGIGFFVMKFMRGGSLSDQMTWGAERELPVERGTVGSLLGRLLPIAEALAALHEHGIVHRDVKPSNILFDETGSAALADLGLAKMLYERSDEEPLTASGMVIGTPFYISPEQLRSEGLSAASDQFSFGVVLYEALSGRLPFGGEDTMSLMVQIVQEPHTPLSEIATGIPRSLAAAVDRMLAKEPKERFPSVRHAVAALENSLVAPTAEAERTTARGRWVSSLRKLRRWF